MKAGQNDIDHITGESMAVVSSSPFIGKLAEEGFGGTVHGGPCG